MTDTTITITPEERANWREAAISISEQKPHADAMAVSASKLFRLLDALDAVSATRDKAVIANAALSSKLREAEAENARLRAALTPNAETKAVYVNKVKIAVDMTYHEDSCTIRQDVHIPWTAIKGVLALIRKQAGQEAARRAVAGEGEVRE